MNIAIIAPSSATGGVATVLHDLDRCLVGEGFRVDLIKFGKGRIPFFSTIYDDVLNTKYLGGHDLNLYMGSIPWPSHVLDRLLDTPTALFVHGYVYHEFLHTMWYGARLSDRIGAPVLLALFKTAAFFKTIDLYIAHSLSLCEANNISDRFVLLPQWVIPEELESFARASYPKKSAIRIVAYTSYSDSPRLLNTNHMIALARTAEHMVERKFELVIVDPRGHISSLGPVKIVGPMRRQEFLSLLASADLYIERNTDEKLGKVALEAMAIGTPAAKLTHRRYLDRQDYREDDLLLAHSFKEFSLKIAEYINNISHYYPYYSKRGKKFVQTKRTWDAVKGPFLEALKHICQ